MSKEHKPKAEMVQVEERNDAQLPQNAMVIPDDWGLKQTYGALITSIPETTQEGKDEILAAMMSAGDNPAEWVNKEIELANVTMHPIQFVNKETGEEVKTVRVLLHLKGGEIIDFRSEGILKSLYLIFRFKGKPPYKAPVRLLLERIPLDAGRSMYSLRPVPKSKKKTEVGAA